VKPGRGNKDQSYTDTRIANALWSIIDKYHISYGPSGKESRDTLNILKRFPLIKTLSFPEGITVEFRRHSDCHEHIEFMIFFDSVEVSALPVYGTTYYRLHMKNNSGSYITAFAAELNKTFRLMRNYLTTGSPVKFSNSVFLFRSSFVHFIMNEMYFFHFERLRDPCLLDKYKQNLADIDFDKNKIPYSKKQALDNLTGLQDDEHCNLYGLMNSMILKFEYPQDSLAADSIKVEAINPETFIEWIW
jgi:hypothetical protein